MAEGQLKVAVYPSVCIKIFCSVKIILKILSNFDPFMGSQQFLCMHKSQILFTNVQWNHNQQFPLQLDHYFLRWKFDRCS